MWVIYATVLNGADTIPRRVREYPTRSAAEAKLFSISHKGGAELHMAHCDLWIDSMGQIFWIVWEQED